MKTLKILVGTFAIALMGCQSQRFIQDESGTKSLNGFRSHTKYPGTFRAIGRLDDCQKATAKAADYSLSVNGQKIGKSKPTCDGAGTMIVDFKGTAPAGSVSVDTADENQPHATGRLFFRPVNADADSGPDATYVGATALDEGVKKGVVDTNAGNQTDWYKIQFQKFTSCRVNFTATSKDPEFSAPGVSVQLYRMVQGRLTPMRKIEPGKIESLQLEGQYFLAVRAPDYGPGFDYTLALLKVDGGGTGTNAPAVGAQSSASFRVTDAWPAGNSTTSIVFNAGEKQGVKIDDELKIFKQNKFLGICKVTQASASEAQCQTGSSVAFSPSLNIRRNL